MTLKSQLLQTVKIIALAIILTLILSTVSAEPTAYPPAGNTPAPINAGTSAQIKNGGLGLNALSVFGSGYIQQKLGIGTDTPSTSLDVTGDTKSSRFCLGSSCISAWSEAGSQTTSIDWNNVTNKPSGFADNDDDGFKAINNYSVSRNSIGTSSSNIGSHNFCALSNVSILDGSESCQSDCNVYKSGSSWFLSAKQGHSCPSGYSSVSCKAMCIN